MSFLLFKIMNIAIMNFGNYEFRRAAKQREHYNKLVKSVKEFNNLNLSEKRSVKYVNGIPQIVPDMVNRPVKYVGAAGDENSTSGMKCFSDTSETSPMCGEQLCK